MLVSVSYRPITVVFLFLILPWLTVLSISPVHAEAEPSSEKSEDADTRFGFTVYPLTIGIKNYIHGEPMKQIENTGASQLVLMDELTGNFFLVFRYATAAYTINQNAIIGPAKERGIHLPTLDISDTVRMHSVMVGCRYYLDKANPMKPFVEMGPGLSSPVPPYDEGVKPALAASMGLEYTLLNRWNLYAETRLIGWRQRDFPEVWAAISPLYESKTVLTISNENFLGLGYTF